MGVVHVGVPTISTCFLSMMHCVPQSGAYGGEGVGASNPSVAKKKVKKKLRSVIEIYWEDY